MAHYPHQDHGLRLGEATAEVPVGNPRVFQPFDASADAAEPAEAKDAVQAQQPFAVRPSRWQDATNGAAVMQAFLQEHLTGILQPITEHVEDVEDAVRQLSASMRDSDSKAAAEAQRLANQEAALDKYKSEMVVALDAIRAELRPGDVAVLAGHTEHLDELSRGHAKAGAALGKAEQRLEKAEAAIDALRKALADSDAARHESDLKNWQTRLISQRVEDELAAINDKLSALEDGHMDLRSNILRTGALADKLNTLMSELPTKEAVDDCIKAVRLATRDIASLMARDAELKETMANLSGTVVQNGVRISATESKLEDVHDICTKLQSELAVLGVKTDDQTSAVRRLDDLEGSVRDVTARLDKELAKRTADRLLDLSDQVQENRDKLKEHSGALSDLQTEVGAHGHQLANLCNDQVPALESKHQASAERITQLAEKAEDLGHLHSALEIGLAHQQSETEKAQLGVKRLNRDLDAACNSIVNVQDGLKRTNEEMEKIAANIDLAHDYLEGLSKGVVDTHTKVSVGQDKLLAPKVEKRTLPTLPGPKPRSLTGTIATPRGVMS